MPSSTTKSEKASPSRSSNKTTAEEIASRDVSFTLFRHLERETKRIRSGLVQLGKLEGRSNRHFVYCFVCV